MVVFTFRHHHWLEWADCRRLDEHHQRIHPRHADFSFRLAAITSLDITV
jgi:hypothetical protein